MPYKDPVKQRAAQAKWGRKNRTITNEYRATNRAEKKAYVDALKDAPCRDCDQQYPPIVMDFDHVRGDKVMPISQLVGRNHGWEKIKAELDKCELVCANCHRLRTYRRANGCVDA